MGQHFLAQVDTSVPYPSTTQLWTIKLFQNIVLGLYLKEEDPPHLHSLRYSLVPVIFKLSRF